MTNELRDAKQRLKTAGCNLRFHPCRNSDVSQAKASLRRAAAALHRPAGKSRREWAAWVERAPWHAIFMACLAGVASGGRNPPLIWMVVEALDLAACRCQPAGARTFRREQQP